MVRVMGEDRRFAGFGEFRRLRPGHSKADVQLRTPASDLSPRTQDVGNGSKREQRPDWDASQVDHALSALR